MHIMLIYRPDRYRAVNSAHILRSAEIDFQFLKGLCAMAARINKTISPDDILIFKYVQEAYSFEKVLAYDGRALPSKQYTQALDALQTALSY